MRKLRLKFGGTIVRQHRRGTARCRLPVYAPLHDLHGGDRAIALEGVDALDHLRHLMLKIEGAPRQGVNGERASDLALALTGPGPADAVWFAGGRQPFAGDRRPLRQKVGIGKTVAGEALPRQRAEVLVERFHGFEHVAKKRGGTRAFTGV